MHNPATLHVLALLKTDTTDQSTHFSLLELITNCQKAGVFDQLSDDSSEVVLFKKNFLAMNALFQAQRILWEENIGYLHISPLSNYLSPLSQSIISNAATRTMMPSNARDSALADYYLDWQHYDNTGEKEVKDLLQQFWGRYVSPDRIEVCCKQLALNPKEATQALAKQHFKRRAAVCHPDKGGSQQAFIELREAYEYLKGVLPS